MEFATGLTTPDKLDFLRRHVERFDAVLRGLPFTFEGSDFPVRALLVPDATAREYEAIGETLGLDRVALFATILVLGGEVLKVAVEKRAAAAVEVPDGAAVN